MDSLLYTLSETVHKQNYAVATYHISLPKEVDVLKKAAALQWGRPLEHGFPYLELQRRFAKNIWGRW